MSYVRETLAPGEDIVKVAHFNWTYWAPTWIWLFVSILPLCYAAFLSIEDRLPGDPVWVYGISAIPAALGLLGLMSHWIYIITTEIAVTSSRFIFKKGLVSRHSNEVSLNKIEEISLDQTVMGRIFGYGRLILRGTGVGVIKLPDIDNPIEFRRAIEGAKSRLREAPDDREYPASPSKPETPFDPSPNGMSPTAIKATVGSEKKKKKTKLAKRKGQKTFKAPVLPQKLR
ncbi:PH domain-containing protein [Parvularcula marina]|uniref:PH domain-containing protein n=1 Tax=Parvularcula marina TaxID=2292771 RepID=A0A371RHN4_9PROT|nr:PH domain-containing protein [Parvularcula marina]RFB04967.1 PH domain-containing protein [Parvularcula marina]